MAKATIRQTTVVDLQLTKEEARWLKSLVQNPIHATHPSQEDPQDKKNRSALWNALPSLEDLVDRSLVEGGY